MWARALASCDHLPPFLPLPFQEEGTIDNYASRPEAFKTDDFFNWHALFESIKRKLPFLNWEAFPKLKGLRSVTPDAQ
uniref:Keratinocyte differentiation associated protein n=1 Tax=Saimiri boliviensis boliviensis TaxID=39432 RepID=A0A2K6UE21_SAIBB